MLDNSSLSSRMGSWRQYKVNVLNNVDRSKKENIAPTFLSCIGFDTNRELMSCCDNCLGHATNRLRLLCVYVWVEGYNHHLTAFSVAFSLILTFNTMSVAPGLLFCLPTFNYAMLNGKESD